jgi:hypothetical protein
MIDLVQAISLKDLNNGQMVQGLLVEVLQR